MHWKIFTGANTPEKATKVMNDVINRLAAESDTLKIEAYPKGGFTCSIRMSPKSDKWSDIVLESLKLAQAIGRGWVLTGDICNELDVWSNEPKVAGVKSIHLVATANAYQAL